MTIKTNAAIKDFDGNDLMHPADPAKPLTVGAVIIGALMSNNEDERNLAWDEKLKRFKLAERFIEDKVEVTNQEAAEIERLVAKVWGVIVVGRLATVLARPAEKGDVT